jgi:hypothetical protein
MDYLVVEYPELAAAIDTIQRLTFPDMDVDREIKMEFRLLAEELLIGYLGLKDILIEDSIIWIYEECCSLFDQLTNTPLWRRYEYEIESLKLIDFRGGVLIKLKRE